MVENKLSTPQQPQQDKHLSTNSAMDFKSDVSTLAPSAAPSVNDEKPTRPQSQTSEPTQQARVLDEKTEADISAQSIAEPKHEPDADAVAVADASPDDEDANTEYPSGAKLVLITIALCLSVFCMALDNTIIATAIPRITDQFHSSNGKSVMNKSHPNTR